MDRHETEKMNIPSVSEPYSLEEIMREFGTAPPQESPPPGNEEEVVKIHNPKPKAKKKVSDDTMVFEPVHAEQLAPDLEAPMKIAPEDKLPEAKFSPPKLEVLRNDEKKSGKSHDEVINSNAPKSAQEALKLCRQGLSMRHIRLLIAVIPVFFGLFLILYEHNGWTFLPFVQSLGDALPITLLIITAALSYDVFLATLTDLLHLRIGINTLSVTAVILLPICVFHDPNAVSYCAVVSLLLYAQLRALHLRRVAQFHTLRTVCSFEAPMGIFDTPKLLENTDSLRRESGDTAAFLEKLDSQNAPEKILRIYSTAMFLLLPALAFMMSVAKELPMTRLWLLFLFAAIPCGGALAFVQPFAAAAKKLSSFRGALCGWYGAKIFGGKHTIVVTDEDLFPKKNITSNGMKLYGTHKAPRIIAYALAALKLVDSPLTELFESLLQAHYGKSMQVSQYRLYNDGGIGAEISGDIVLVGSLAFMRSMGVHMPAGTRVRQAVYVSVDGELAGIFAVKYKPSTSSKAGLRDVLANHNFSIVLATRDFLISPELIAAKYELPTDAMRFPDYTERLRLQSQKPQEAARQGALIAKDTFGAFAVTVASGRTVRISTLICLTISILAGLSGLALCMGLLTWDAIGIASALHLATFRLLWSLLSAFISFVMLKF